MIKQCLIGVLIAGGLQAGYAQSPDRINLSDPNLVIVDDSVIPIPLEIFASLDKLGAQNWSAQVEKRDIVLDTNRSRTAMLFGLIVSDGFIAVQAKDKEGVKRMGREVLRLASSLGVASSVEEHANSIITHAGHGDWAVVRKELDRTRQTVINQMKELRDEELVDLVSLGGWLGGTEALSTHNDEALSPRRVDSNSRDTLGCVNELCHVFRSRTARLKGVQPKVQSGVANPLVSMVLL